MDLKNKLTELIDTYDLNAVKDKLFSIAEEAIMIKITEEEDYTKVGSSRLCGYPDLPKEIEWPRIKEVGENMYKEDIGLLKLFLCQINLEELTDIGKLPQKGMLYFFIGSNCFWGYGKRDSEIFYHSDKLNEVQDLIGKVDKTFCTYKLPEDKYQLEHGYKIEFEKVLTIPNDTSEILESLNLSEEEGDKYSELYYEYLDYFCERFNKLNMMFGHVDRGGENIRENARSYKKTEKKENWEVIFNIWSDLNTELNFNDAGSFSFLILDEDLKKMNFEQIKTNLWSS